MARRTLPTTDTGLIAWSLNFKTQITATPVAYGAHSSARERVCQPGRCLRCGARRMRADDPLDGRDNGQGRGTGKPQKQCAPPHA
jgi:hypothetical protein